MLPNEKPLQISDLNPKFMDSVRQSTTPQTTGSKNNKVAGGGQQQQQQQQQQYYSTPGGQKSNSSYVPSSSKFSYTNTPKSTSKYGGMSGLGKPTSTDHGLGEMILEEIISEDDSPSVEEYDDDDQSEHSKSSLFSPKSKQPKTPRRYKLVPAACTCPVHDHQQDSNNKSVLCPRCSSQIYNTSTTTTTTTTPPVYNGSGYQYERNRNPYFIHSTTPTAIPPIPQPPTPQPPPGKLHFENSVTPSQLHQSSYRKSEYNVRSTGVPERDIQLLKSEVDDFESQLHGGKLSYSAGSSSHFNGGLFNGSAAAHNIPNGKVFPFSSTPSNSTHFLESQLNRANEDLLHSIKSHTSHTSHTSQIKPPIPSYNNNNSTTQQPPYSPLPRPTQQYHSSVHQSPSPESTNQVLVEQQKQQINSLMNKLNTANQTIEQYRVDLSDKGKEINSLTHQLSNVHLDEDYLNRIVEYGTLHEIQKLVTRLKNRLDPKRKAEDEDDENQIEEIRMDVSNQKKSEKLLDELVRISSQFSDLENNYVARHSNLNREIERLNNRVEIKDRELLKIREQMESQSNMAHQQINQLNKSIREFNQERENYKNQFETLGRELNDLQNRNSEYESSLRLNKKEINDLTNQIEDQRLKIEDLLEENEDMKERLSKVYFITQDSPRRPLTNLEMQNLTPNKSTKVLSSPPLTSSIHRPVNSYYFSTPMKYTDQPINTGSLANGYYGTSINKAKSSSSGLLSDIGILKPKTNSPMDQLNGSIKRSLEKKEKEEDVDVNDLFNIGRNLDFNIQVDQNNNIIKEEKEEVVKKSPEKYHIPEEEPLEDEEESDINYSDAFGSSTDDLSDAFGSSTDDLSDAFESTTQATTNGSHIEIQKYQEEQQDDNDDNWLKSPKDKNNNFGGFFSSSNMESSNGSYQKESNGRIKLSSSLSTPVSSQSSNGTLSSDSFPMITALTSDQLKRNIPQSDILLSPEFKSNSPIEAKLHEYLKNNHSLYSHLPADFSKLGENTFKYGKFKIQISLLNNELIVMLGQGKYEKFSNFVEKYRI